MSLETVIQDLTLHIKQLTLAVIANTSAIKVNTSQEGLLMADLTLLTNVVTQLAADDSALKTSLDALVAAYQAAKTGGFTAQNQADLDIAIASLTTVHSNLVADATEATTSIA